MLTEMGDGPPTEWRYKGCSVEVKWTECVLLECILSECVLILLKLVTEWIYNGCSVEVKWESDWWHAKVKKVSCSCDHKHAYI